MYGVVLCPLCPLVPLLDGVVSSMLLLLMTLADNWWFLSLSWRVIPVGDVWFSGDFILCHAGERILTTRCCYALFMCNTVSLIHCYKGRDKYEWRKGGLVELGMKMCGWGEEIGVKIWVWNRCENVGGNSVWKINVGGISVWKCGRENWIECGYNVRIKCGWNIYVKQLMESWLTFKWNTGEHV